ncbi:hypothetical protein B0H14DRAFT_3492506 [Mycena olivaceomarginata]|nr:hypothetical protein B0H14DRAFT_3492506 [Mycena olivaceomarginata]
MDWDETLTPKFRRAQQAKPLLSWITQLEQSCFLNGFITRSPSNRDTVYTIVRLARLIENITPQNEPNWWPQKLESPMTEIFASLSELEVFLLRWPKDPSKTLEDVVTVASTRFLPALKKLDSGDSDLHNGQDPGDPLLDSLFTAARKSAPVLPERQLENLMSVVENAAARIYAHILTFRSSRLREHYDPDGVARLDKAMRETRQKFPVREEYDSQLEFLKLNIRWIDVSHVEKAITVHFGSTWMVAEIKASSLQMGPHGIDGFFEHVVCYVIDEMPVDRPSYHAKLRLIQHFCEKLAIRMETFTEVVLPSIPM